MERIARRECGQSPREAARPKKTLIFSELAKKNAKDLFNCAIKVIFAVALGRGYARVQAMKLLLLNINRIFTVFFSI
jgi:hypothetical protein